MATTSTALPRSLKVANRVVKALQRVGVPMGVVHVLTVPGRRSGRPRSTPVSPFTVAGRRYVVAAEDRADWALNARAAGRGQLASGRHRRAVLLREVHDPEVRRAVMREFPVLVPQGVRFYQHLGLVTRADPEEFAAISDRVGIFEVLPDPSGAAPGAAPGGVDRPRSG